MESNSKFPKRGEIWLVNFSYNYNQNNLKELEFEIESNIKKIRPAVIVSNDLQNEFDRELFVVPITSQDLDYLDPFFEILLKKDEVNNLSKDSKILTKSLRPIDKIYRLKKYCGKVNSKVLSKIEEGIKLILNL
ncbi:MAG: Endoribonuclease MazF9 [Mycoplasmataceae bacterium]|nr:MAG: Endoribonuclease MazF9 [Mycoplasmataceae bacterium]